MNILIIKTGALGDVLRCTFLAQALKDKYKTNNPKIYWITSKEAKPLFINNPYIDTVLIDNPSLPNYLRNLHFNLVINLEEAEKFAKLVISLKPDFIRGFYYKNEVVPSKSTEEWFNMSLLGKKPQNDILKKKNRKTHRQLMAEIAGIDFKKYEPFLRLTQEQRKISADFLRRHNLSRADLIIGINTGAADRWPKSLSIKQTAQLIDLIYKKYRAKILLFGGPNEIERNNEILRLSKSPVITAGCGNDLLEFPALISVCNLLITTDSLGLHISLALKRKTICLIGPTSPYEIEMYGLGEKIIAKSKCICCYKKDCKSMEKIETSDIANTMSRILNQKITLLITTFNEPNVEKAIQSAINQKTRYDYDIIVSAPDERTQNIVKKYSSENKKIKLFKDPGRGKSYALNMIFENLDTDILILTDGDVFMTENSVENIMNLFLDPEIGCVTGKPIPFESKKFLFGYWANFLFHSAHKLRENAFQKNEFLECSGYLFAFRKKMINSIPVDVAEDSVIPYFFWEKGYLIGYASEAGVFVKNPRTWKDWLSQKIRTSKSHETLGKYVNVKITPRVKTFKTEAMGISWLFYYPENIQQFFWSILLAFSRLYMWMNVFLDTKLMKKNYNDAWKRIESTK